MLTLEQLDQFLTIVKYMNFTRAADSMFISHSTVSRNIARLESELGVKLFDRSSRHVTLTDAGKRLAARGESLMRLMTEMEADVRAAEAGTCGTLRISVGRFFCRELFDVFSLYRQRFPRVSLELDFSRVNIAAADLAGGRADLGFFCLFPDDGIPAGCQLTKLLRGRLCALVPDTHPLASAGRIPLQDISRSDLKPVCGLSSDGTGKFVWEENLPAAMLRVKTGCGMAVLPRHMASEFGAGLSVLEIDGQGDLPCYDIAMLRSKNSSNPALPPLLEMIGQRFDAAASAG